MKLLLEAPLNKLSFGQVSYNLYLALKRIGIDIGIMPMGGNVDLSCFSLTDKCISDLKDDVEFGRKILDKNQVALKLWHLNGGESSPTNKTSLYTFYELDEPTEFELNVARRQENIIFSSAESRDAFISGGLNAAATHNCHVGFDPQLKVAKKKDLGACHWGIMGKLEKRKHTIKVIQVWLAKFGNSKDHKLTACIDNPFLPQHKMKQIIETITENGKYKNVQFLPFMPKNSMVNEFINSLDIDVSGLGSEGWGLPSFNATALGKWSVVGNCTAQKDWATPENCILVEPSGKVECYDGVFFGKDQPFNQGNIYDFDPIDISRAFDSALSKVGMVNDEGLKLQGKFSYDKMAEKLSNIVLI